MTATLNATDFANLIDHIQVADGSGRVFANIPGGNFVYDNYTRYSIPVPTSVQSNVIASAATSGSATLVYRNLRIPAAAGGETGCQLTVYYSAILSSASAMTATSKIIVRFGNCQGYKTRYAVQSLNLASGDNLLQTNSVPQSNMISELFIRKLGTDSYLSYVRIQTNNIVIEQQLNEPSIVQRDLDRFYGAFETGTLVLAEPGQWAMNSTSEFDVNMSSAVNNVQFVWVWYEPATAYSRWPGEVHDRDQRYRPPEGLGPRPGSADRGPRDPGSDGAAQSDGKGGGQCRTRCPFRVVPPRTPGRDGRSEAEAGAYSRPGRELRPWPSDPHGQYRSCEESEAREGRNPFRSSSDPDARAPACTRSQNHHADGPGRRSSRLGPSVPHLR